MKINECISGLLGGALIGVSVSIMFVFNGRVTGISGIISSLLQNPFKQSSWRFFFLAGLLAGGFILAFSFPDMISNDSESPLPTVMLAGLLVGFGTVLGSGCTSGHGVCGISRLSIRSLVATLVFIISGMASIMFFRAVGWIS